MYQVLRVLRVFRINLLGLWISSSGLSTSPWEYASSFSSLEVPAAVANIHWLQSALLESAAHFCISSPSLFNELPVVVIASWRPVDESEKGGGGGVNNGTPLLTGCGCWLHWNSVHVISLPLCRSLTLQFRLDVEKDNLDRKGEVRVELLLELEDWKHWTMPTDANCQLGIRTPYCARAPVSMARHHYCTLYIIKTDER